MRWISVVGNFEAMEDGVVFQGGTLDLPGREPGFQVGNCISDQYFGSGSLHAEIQFKDTAQASACGLILYYHPETQGFVCAQIGGPALVSIRTFGRQEWTVHAQHGPSEQLKPDRSYELDVLLRGSEVTVSLDGIRILKTRLPFVLPRGQMGVFAMGPKNICVSAISVHQQRPTIFVIMQFTPPFNELYSEVIVPVGEELGFDVVRADETYGPGIIIADIERQIIEASAVIADITPNNPNVYWEVGYSHALRKPTILVAEHEKELPFDVSPFRILFYENTIAGKSQVEAGLRKHIEAIQSQWLTG